MWLRDLNVTLRTFNDVWLRELSQFMKKTLSVVQQANLLANQGGPIIMLQIENEYGNMEDNYGWGGKEYVRWLSNYAQSLTVSQGIPWIMCQQGEGVGTAPAPAIVNACNGFYCDDWITKHAAAFPNQPHMWTENWPGWFQNWGEPIPHRPAVDVAYAVAKWFAKGGSYMNYYMVFGGTTFGRSVGGPLIVTSYDYDVAINEFAQPNEPKFSLLGRLHALLFAYEDLLLEQTPTHTVVSAHCEAYRYASANDAITFYINSGENVNAPCSFPLNDDATGGQVLDVPAWSVSIATGAQPQAAAAAVFNTKSTIATAPLPANTKVFTPVSDFALNPVVHSVAEPIPSYVPPALSSVIATQPLEQLSLTGDSTDYLWYSSLVPAASLFENGESMGVTVTFQAGTSAGSMFYVYWNGALVASTFGEAGGNPINPAASAARRAASASSSFPPTTVSLSFTVSPSSPAAAAEEGEHHLDILSVSMGLKNYGPFLETIQVGIVSPNVTVTAVQTEAPSRTSSKTFVPTSYLHTVGLQRDAAGSARVCDSGDAATNGLCWFTTTFATPAVVATASSPVSMVLDLGATMGKGMVSVNGHMLGRYWNIAGAATASQRDCAGVGCSAESYMDFVGAYNGDRCRSDCGAPSQTYYKLPWDWLNHEGSGENTLEIFEEIGGNVHKLRLFTVSMA